MRSLLLVAVAVVLVGSSVQAATIPVLDGAYASPFVQNSASKGVMTTNDTKGGEACTKIDMNDTTSTNALYMYAGSGTTGQAVPLAGNTTLSGWVWVDSLLSTSGHHNGVDAVSLRMYDAANALVWATGKSADWFPTVAGQWQHFEMNFSTAGFFDGGVTADVNTWKVTRMVLKTEATTSGGTFWVRDLEIVPEPATMSLLGLGLIGLLRRRR